MKVRLLNVADYEIKEDKVTDVPFKTFVNLCGKIGYNGETGETKETVRLFKSMEDFKNISYEEMEEINQEANVKILPNGQFLVFLKPKSSNNKEKSNTTVKNNVTADTETYKGE